MSTNQGTVTIDVYLEDEDGNFIVDENGDKIIIGSITVNETITYVNWGDLLDGLDLADVKDGFRLAHNVRGPLMRFDVTEGDTGDYVVMYNYQQLGGRFQNLGTCVGAIAGTYARRGGWVIPSILPRPTS